MGAILTVIRSGGLVDRDVDALWSRIETEYHANQRVIVMSLEEKQSLRPGLEVDRAADILWAVNHPTLWQLLVGERGWTPEDYEQWTADVACSQLLERP